MSQCKVGNKYVWFLSELEVHNKSILTFRISLSSSASSSFIHFMVQANKPVPSSHTHSISAKYTNISNFKGGRGKKLPCYPHNPQTRITHVSLHLAPTFLPAWQRRLRVAMLPPPYPLNSSAPIVVLYFYLLCRWSYSTHQIIFAVEDKLWCSSLCIFLNILLLHLSWFWISSIVPCSEMHSLEVRDQISRTCIWNKR
jgi:hypothetical protein